MLLDAPSLYFRAFHGVPTTITAPDGTPVNAVRGFLDAVSQLLRAYPAQRLVACFDNDWRPAFRVELIPEYKAHRVGPDGGDQTPDELLPQVAVIEEVLDAVGLARTGADGYEADDVIGTLAARHAGPVDVVTGDRDLLQLVRDDQPVRVLYIGRGVAKLEVFDEAAVTARYGIPGRAYAEFAILRGDPSDGLTGIPGVGEKTAAGLVNRYGTARAAVAAEARLSAHRDYIERAERVVEVVGDAPVAALDDTLPREPRHPEAVVALGDRWGLDSPMNRLLAALAGGA